MAISVENRKTFPPRVFCAPAEVVPLGIGYRRSGTKTRMMGLSSWERSLTISSAVWIQSRPLTWQTDRRTDGRTPGDSIASRGKKYAWATHFETQCKSTAIMSFCASVQWPRYWLPSRVPARPCDDKHGNVLAPGLVDPGHKSPTTEIHCKRQSDNLQICGNMPKY